MATTKTLKKLPKFDRKSVTQKRDRRYPAKLVQSEKDSILRDENSPEDGFKITWLLVYENPGRVYPDGNPAKGYNRAFLAFTDEKGDVTEFANEGSMADKMGEAFIECIGVDMMPDTDETADYLNHWFMVEDVNVNAGLKEKDGSARRAYYVTFPREYIGEDYEYDGPVVKIKPRNDDDAGGEAVAEVDEGALGAVAALLVGMDANDAKFGPNFLRALKEDEELSKATTLVLPSGASLRGAAARKGSSGHSVLVEELEEAGLITINDDGIIEEA